MMTGSSLMSRWITSLPVQVALVFLLLAVGACSDDAGPTGPGVEIEPAIPAAATAWLQDNVHTFESADPSENMEDLAFLQELVGDARVVALGEATHGTQEFQQMKDRIVRYLVREMRFDALAMEVSWPEANRMDSYVRSGVGEPETLQAGLYFFLARTQEVLDMIGWMRSSNATGTPVGFYGFDMQYPGMAIETVERFLAATDSSVVTEVAARLDCLRPYANTPTSYPPEFYDAAPPEYRDACHEDLTWVHDALAARQEDLSALGGTESFQRTLRSARVLVQFEEMSSGRQSRDDAMAENALWLLDQLGPDGKLILWAHNEHIATNRDRMGQRLREALGDDLVSIGFTFARGYFNAVLTSGSHTYGLQELSAELPPDDSYEAYFLSTRMPRLALDLRDRPFASDSSAWLHGPLLHRLIGATYDRNHAEAYFYLTDLTQDFDATIFFVDTTASTILVLPRPETFFPYGFGDGWGANRGGL